jgi:hypothetical protein
MRAKWYGDKRDLVKWSVLLHLALQVHAERIVQVTCLVPDSYDHGSDDRADLAQEFGSEIADSVCGHFRNLGGVEELGRRAGVDVVVVSDEYPVSAGERELYFLSVVRKWLPPTHEQLIVFLDPDTGLGKTRKHVSARQLQIVRDAMKAGDALVFYQHAPRYENGDWRVQAQEAFADALAVPTDTIARRLCAVAKDVMFLIWQAGQ